MSRTIPRTVYLKDYTVPPFLVDSVDIHVSILEDYTEVSSTLQVRRNPAAGTDHRSLRLDGHDLILIRISVDDVELTTGQYVDDDEGIVLSDLPDTCAVSTTVRIKPEDNTALEGLYASKDGYFTQCEAQGFRRITYFPDRPDVMSRYTTTIEAPRARFPVLLSNGNLEASGEAQQGRHWARWVDPFPKPAYLFALVAADLELLKSNFRTASGRDVDLKLYVEPGKLDQCEFAMDALKSSMRWDEDVFGLELDLDTYMIVAVGDFNMGAMENKGLNIFNTKYILARPDTATDSDFMMLDRVVAHEYFHNWTGNRVTCRDWFQLSLKEGLTVFRDQLYGGDRYSHAVQRIQEVRLLRSAQFPEDAGPMAHPVRPDSYIEISNFYTATVYNKGAEVVRMIHTLLGVEGFRAGMDLYFERHDGEAVCTEDFAAAMSDASGIDLEQFKRWYNQAGTPVVSVHDDYDAASKTYTLTLQQNCPSTPGQDSKLPFHIPVSFGLLLPGGEEITLTSESSSGTATTGVLSLTEPEQVFTFADVAARPVPSLLRGFSAPVMLEYDYADDDLALLAEYDSDSFNRWEAGQRLAISVLLTAIEQIKDGRDPSFNDTLVNVFDRALGHADDDPAFTSEFLSLPTTAWLSELVEEVDPDAVLAARTALRRHLATALEARFAETYMAFTVDGPYSPEPGAAGRRALRNQALGYLMELDTPEIRSRCHDQLTTADNLTDSMAALGALANCECDERFSALKWFYNKARDEALVLDKWFAVQATSRLPNTIDDVTRLLEHDDFDIKNPNRVRAVIGAFCHSNQAGFHRADGRGYEFGANQVIALDRLNPQIAARLARSFDRWRKFDTGRRIQAEAALARIRDTKDLSKDTFEVVNRALG